MEYFDSELIIKEVEKRPCIYDKNHPDFKNRNSKREAWIGVTIVVVGEKWNKLDKAGKTNTEKEVQKRWKSMKDSYFKSIKTQEERSGDSGKPKRPYVYSKQMAFLLSVWPDAETSSNMEIEPEEVLDVVLSHTSTPPSRAQESVSIDHLRKSDPLIKKRKWGQYQKEIINALKVNAEKVANYSKHQTKDPDEMFLLSQLPVIKKLSATEKIDFQIKFMQLLQSYTSPR